MNQTPVNDKALNAIIEVIWRRLTSEVKTLSTRLPASELAGRSLPVREAQRFRHKKTATGL